MDLPAMNFTRLRLSGSLASSPRIVDAPASPTKSVYLDVDETTPTSPQLRSPYGTKTAAAVRRTNFFDDDSSSDEDVDDKEEEELETADEHSFSQRQSFIEEDEGRGRARSRSRSRSLHTATTNTTTDGLRAEGSTRKGAYYLGVRPEEYAFVCGTRPASSVFRNDCYGGGGSGGGEMVGLDASPLRGGRSDGEDGYMGSRRVGEYVGVYEDGVPEPQRETLRREGVSAKHVPFGAPDLAVAARRVLQEQMRRPSSNVLPSASEYEDGEMEAVRGEGGDLRNRPVPFGSGNGAGVVSSGGNSGKPRLSDAFEESNDGAVVETQSLQSKTDDNVLAVHAITLQALLRDEEGLQVSASSVRRKSISSDFSRRELFKQQGKSQQPKDSATSLTPPVPDLPPMVQIQQPKRVSVVPPPIDTKRSSRSKSESESKIKTPYPFHHHKNVRKTLGSPGMPPSRPKDTVLTLSIHRRIGVLSPRVARVTLPAELLDSNGPAGAFGDGIAPDETPPPIFDDAAFFKQLRKEYARLAGRWWRFFSARSLRRITVGHTTAWSATESCPGPAACGGGRCCPAARAAHRGVVGHHHHQQQQQRGGCSAATPSGIYHVRSPRYLASQGLKETFSEENLLAHFRKPRLGRSRFAWVLWASRLAGLHEQPDVFSWRAQQQQRQWQRDVDWRDRELPPTPGGARGSDATGRTPSTASTALAGWSEEDVKEDGVVAAAELGLAGGIGLGHSIATLEFVEGWSIARILTAVLLVLLLAAAGIVLWILFGNGVLVDGFRGNGATVGTAVLIGAGVLMIGWTLVLAWMGVSWCVV